MEVSILLVNIFCGDSNISRNLTAFGILARILSETQYPLLADGVSGMELADSITSDAHKLFNVPYDCGIFFSRHLALATSVLQNPGAAYLASAADNSSSIVSPLNIGIENSRRFRALPLYASLRTYGKNGYRDMLERQIAMARRVAAWVLAHEAYELLPSKRLGTQASKNSLDDIFMVVLFRARDGHLNNRLVDLINNSGEIYLSGTSWDGAKAARIAVANWQIDKEKHGVVVERVLHRVAEQWAIENTS
jgi:glutamate/tyrosine decarboxylase-like PLP-dependent enzyme